MDVLCNSQWSNLYTKANIKLYSFYFLKYFCDEYDYKKITNVYDDKNHLHEQQFF